MHISTADTHLIKPFLHKLYIPPTESHKGQNGKVLVIGGSELFHAASIWAAEVASHFVDIVHYSSTKENNEIFLEVKKIFRNGIVVPHAELEYYIGEDDAVLIGPGMVRSDINKYELLELDMNSILKIKDEAVFTRALAYFCIHHFPTKQFVFDAGALQMMDPQWLTYLKKPAIITPHQIEFERLFHISIREKDVDEKKKIVMDIAKQYKCIIILKAIDDIVSDGQSSVIVSGGNQGLTKGGTGDILGGLITSLVSKSDPVVSAVAASYILKRTAEILFDTQGYWYNNDDLIQNIPATLKKLLYNT